MAKPTDYPDWATDVNYPAGPEPYAGTATKDPVTVGQKAYGWEPDKKPPAQNMNDNQNLVGQWTRWLDAADVERMNELIELAPNLSKIVPQESGYDVSTCPFVYALTVGAAHPKQGSTNSKIRISKGTLLQGVSATKMLAYTFDETEAEITIANAAGATPRVDLIEIKIEEDATTDEKRTKVTVQVTQGTPAASPVVPNTTAGFVAYATVVVGASYAAAAGFAVDDTAGAVAVLHDQRMPLGVRDFVVDAGNFNFIEADWARDTYEERITYVGASHMYARCPAGDTAGRIIAASTVQKDPATLVCRFARIKVNASGAAFNTLNDSNMNGSGTNSIRRRFVAANIFEGVHLPSVGPTVLESATNVGCPVWSNGRRAWVNPATFPEGTILGSESIELHQAALHWNFSGAVANQELWRAQFWVAGR